MKSRSLAVLSLVPLVLSPVPGVSPAASRWAPQHTGGSVAFVP